MVVACALTLPGCLTLARTKGAKTLERGQVEVGLIGPALQGRLDPSAQLPVPQGAVEVRIGLGQDVDLGLQGTLLGGGLDVRYRFLQRGPWHVAVAPGAGFVLQPSLFNPAQLGGMEGRLPLLVEVEATPWLSASGGAQLVFREVANLGLPIGVVWRFDLWAGAGARLEAHGGLFAVGLAADVYAVPTTHIPRPVWVAGLDVKLRTRTREEREARRARKGGR